MIRQQMMVAYGMGLLVTLMLLVSSSMAARPHFSEPPDIVKNSDLSITINYEVKDIGKKNANATLSSHTTALIGCINPGGNLSPSKGSMVEDTQIQSEKIKPKDGEFQGSLTLVPPPVPSSLDICPNKNWSTGFLSLTYENVIVAIHQKDSEILKLNLGNISQ